MGSTAEDFDVQGDVTCNSFTARSWGTPSVGDVPTATAAGVEWQPGGGGGGIGGSGTANTVSKFTAATTLGDSQTTDDGTNVATTVTGTITELANSGGGGSAQLLVQADNGGGQPGAALIATTGAQAASIVLQADESSGGSRIDQTVTERHRSIVTDGATYIAELDLDHDDDDNVPAIHLRAFGATPQVDTSAADETSGFQAHSIVLADATRAAARLSSEGPTGVPVLQLNLDTDDGAGFPVAFMRVEPGSLRRASLELLGDDGGGVIEARLSAVNGVSTTSAIASVLSQHHVQIRADTDPEPIVTITAAAGASSAGINLEGDVGGSGESSIANNADRQGFFSAVPVTQPTVTGSRALGFGVGGAGLSLLAALVSLGLVTDGTVP